MEKALKLLDAAEAMVAGATGGCGGLCTAPFQRLFTRAVGSARRPHARLRSDRAEARWLEAAGSPIRFMMRAMLRPVAFMRMQNGQSRA